MSASPRSTFFKLILRLASLPIMISPSAWILNWSSAVSLISSFSRTISALLPLKSNRLASSFLAWLTAFSISIELTCETISKEGIAGLFPRESAETSQKGVGVSHIFTWIIVGGGKEDKHVAQAMPYVQIVFFYRSDT